MEGSTGTNNKGSLLVSWKRSWVFRVFLFFQAVPFEANPTVARSLHSSFLPLRTNNKNKLAFPLTSHFLLRFVFAHTRKKGPKEVVN